MFAATIKKTAVRWYREGLSLREVERRTGVPFPTVRRWCLEAKVPMRNVGGGRTPIVDAVEAAELRLSGWTWAQIGERYGVTEKGAYLAVRKRGGL